MLLRNTLTLVGLPEAHSYACYSMCRSYAYGMWDHSYLCKQVNCNLDYSHNKAPFNTKQKLNVLEMDFSQAMTTRSPSYSEW